MYTPTLFPVPETPKYDVEKFPHYTLFQSAAKLMKQGASPEVWPKVRSLLERNISTISFLEMKNDDDWLSERMHYSETNEMYLNENSKYFWSIDNKYWELPQLVDKLKSLNYSQDDMPTQLKQVEQGLNTLYLDGIFASEVTGRIATIFGYSYVYSSFVTAKIIAAIHDYFNDFVATYEHRAVICKEQTAPERLILHPANFVDADGLDLPELEF